MNQPPKLAVFLLQRLVPEHEPLRGDLLEGVQGGATNLWYWRQVIAAIFVGALRAGRAHPFGVARGLAVGWIVMWTLSRYVAPQILGFDEWLFVRGFRWFYVHGYHVPHPSLWVPILACAFAIGGNLAVRASRVRGPATAVIYAATVLLINTLMFSRWLYHALTTPPPPYGAPIYMSYEMSLVALFVLPTAALMGGLWAARGTKSGGTVMNPVD
jgi:hypothetical protein